MSIIVTDYEPKYFAGLQKLLKDIYESDITEEVLEQHYLDSSKSIILAIDDLNDEVRGCAFIEERYDYVRPDHDLYITYVAVDSNHRKKGIGRLLFDSISARARDLNCMSIELTSANHREGAHAFYKSLGYTVKKTTVFIHEVEE